MTGRVALSLRASRFRLAYLLAGFKAIHSTFGMTGPLPIDCPYICRLHESIDSDNLENAVMLITTHTISALRANYVGFGHYYLP